MPTKPSRFAHFDKVHSPLRLPRETTSERPKVVQTPGVFSYVDYLLSIYLSIYLPIYLSILSYPILSYPILSIYLSIPLSLSLSLSVCLSIYLSLCKLENKAILRDFLH